MAIKNDGKSSERLLCRQKVAGANPAEPIP